MKRACSVTVGGGVTPLWVISASTMSPIKPGVLPPHRTLTGREALERRTQKTAGFLANTRAREAKSCESRKEKMIKNGEST